MLFGGSLIERGCLAAELNIDRLAVDLVSPFEVRTMTLRGIAMAGAGWLAAFHHALGDGTFQEIFQLVEFLPRLAEALIRGAEEEWAGCFAWGHAYRFSRNYSYGNKVVVKPGTPKHFG